MISREMCDEFHSRRASSPLHCDGLAPSPLSPPLSSLVVSPFFLRFHSICTNIASPVCPSSKYMAHDVWGKCFPLSFSIIRRVEGGENKALYFCVYLFYIDVHCSLSFSLPLSLFLHQILWLKDLFSTLRAFDVTIFHRTHVTPITVYHLLHHIK